MYFKYSLEILTLDYQYLTIYFTYVSAMFDDLQ